MPFKDSEQLSQLVGSYRPVKHALHIRQETYGAEYLLPVGVCSRTGDKAEPGQWFT